MRPSTQPSHSVSMPPATSVRAPGVRTDQLSRSSAPPAKPKAGAGCAPKCSHSTGARGIASTVPSASLSAKVSPSALVTSPNSQSPPGSFSVAVGGAGLFSSALSSARAPPRNPASASLIICAICCDVTMTMPGIRTARATSSVALCATASPIISPRPLPHSRIIFRT